MQDFINQWLGRRVDYDHVFNYQCVDLVKQYLYQSLGLQPGSWGDAKQYWQNPNPKILEKMDKIATTGVKAGDIVPLKPVNSQASHAAGHIGIATGAQTGDAVEILEQNGSTGNGSGAGKDAIRKRFVPKSRVYGVLRAKSPAATAYVPHMETVKPGTWNVRSAPSMSGGIKGTVAGSQRFDTQVVNDNWRKINFNGSTGYVGPKAW